MYGYFGGFAHVVRELAKYGGVDVVLDVVAEL